MKLIKVVLIFLILSLSGCGLWTKPDNDNSALQDLNPKLNLPFPEPVKLETIRWVVITHNNYEEVINNAKNKEGLVFLIALDEKGYKALALNNSKILKYLKEQRSILIAYKKYYEEEKQQ